MAHRPYTGYALAAVGVGVLLFQIGLYFYGALTHIDYQVYRPVSYIAMMLGFVGFYMIQPKGALEGAGFIRDTVVAFIEVVRTGKRAGDAIAVQVTPVTAGVPDPSAKTTITIPNPAAVADPAAAAILEAEAAARRQKHELAPPVAPGEEG